MSRDPSRHDKEGGPTLVGMNRDSTTNASARGRRPHTRRHEAKTLATLKSCHEGRRKPSHTQDWAQIRGQSRMGRGAQGAVRHWLRQKTVGPQERGPMQTPIRENERLTGKRSDAQLKSRADGAREQGQRQQILEEYGLTVKSAEVIQDLSTTGLNETEIAQKLRIDERAVYRILEHGVGIRRQEVDQYHQEHDRRMHDIFTPVTEEGRQALKVKGVDKGALYQKDDGTWVPNKPLLAELPTLRGVRGDRKSTTDTVARVVATRQLAKPVAGIAESDIRNLEQRAHAVRDAIRRFTGSDKSRGVETGRELTARASKLCDAAEETAHAARKGDGPTADPASR